MKTFRNYCVSLSLACVFFVSTNVRADVVEFDYRITTINNQGNWQVATLMTQKDKGYVNPETKTVWVGDYRDKVTAQEYTKVGTTWNGNNGIAKNFEKKWDTLNWNTAVQGSHHTWVGDGKDWAVVGSGRNGSNSWDENGFYAFNYSLSTEVLYDNLTSATLNLNVSADDYITAIYANGVQIHWETIVNGTYAGADRRTDGYTNYKDGMWYGIEEWSFDVTNLFVDGMLDLIFVVHNTETGMSQNQNPTGLYIDGWLNVVGKNNPEDSTAVPEPATLAVLGLGLAGLGAARRMRKKKM